MGRAHSQEMASQLPFGWVCFSNLSRTKWIKLAKRSQLPFGWVCFSNNEEETQTEYIRMRLNCLSAGSVSLTRADRDSLAIHPQRLNCLSAGSVSLTRIQCRHASWSAEVSIAFRLGLFL